MDKEIIDDLDTPGELEGGHREWTVHTTTLNAARQALRDWLAEAEDRFKLTPLEVLAVAGTVLGDLLEHEGQAERAALSGIQDAMTQELDPEPPKPEPVILTPMCCRKHNMMGRDDGGDCKGGPVAGGKPKLQRPVAEIGGWDAGLGPV